MYVHPLLLAAVSVLPSSQHAIDAHRWPLLSRIESEGFGAVRRIAARADARLERFSQSARPQRQETIEALRALIHALVDEAEQQQSEAKPHQEAVAEDFRAFAAKVDLILTDEQQTAIREQIDTFRQATIDEKVAQAQALLAAIDKDALIASIEAIRDAEPQDRPDAIHAAVRLVIEALAPTWSKQFQISERQSQALELAADELWNASRDDRVALAALRAERREAAWATLIPEQQSDLMDAAVRIGSYIDLIREWWRSR